MFIFKKQLTLIFLILSLILPRTSLAITLNLEYPSFGGFDINENQDLNQVIAWFYYLIIAISGFSAFYMLVKSGFTWLTSAGSTTKITQARSDINQAILGLIIILTAYLILQVINPDLTTLRLPSF